MTDDLDARVILSEMTDITGRTIDEAFHRDADLAALYRDVPSAFWLAPDADLSIPQTPAGRILVSPDRPAQLDAVATIDGQGKAMLMALLAAGPAFAAIAFGVGGGMPDDAWWQPFARIVTSLFVLPFTILVGIVLGVVPIVLGTLVLGQVGAHRHWLQRPDVWVGTGAAMGTAIAALFGAPGSVTLSLIATSMLCAGIARHAVTWHDPAFA